MASGASESTPDNAAFGRRGVPERGARQRTDGVGALFPGLAPWATIFRPCRGYALDGQIRLFVLTNLSLRALVPGREKKSTPPVFREGCLFY